MDEGGADRGAPRPPTRADLIALRRGLTLDDLRARLEVADYDGVPIPFASPEALTDTKATVRPHDADDRLFLADLIARRGGGS